MLKHAHAECYVHVQCTCKYMYMYSNVSFAEVLPCYSGDHCCSLHSLDALHQTFIPPLPAQEADPEKGQFTSFSYVH